jgi:hypothetical protein
VSLREECDAAEVVWGALLDRQASLRLLAMAARIRGASAYQAPSAVLKERLEEEPYRPTGLSREAEVMAFVAGTGEG